MYSPAMEWQQPYMMVGVPMMGGPADGYGAATPMDPRSLSGMSPAGDMVAGYFPALAPGGCGAGGDDSGLKYPGDSIVMAAGQYREVRPTLSPPLQVAGGRFVCDRADLPSGLQLDPSTGIIWGTPAPPAVDDAAGAYRDYTIIYSSSAGSASASIGLKVVNFQPQNFKITHISQLERNKYMVLIDARQKQ